MITFHIQCLQVLQIFNTVWQNWYSISFQIQDLQKKEYMYVFFDKNIHEKHNSLVLKIILNCNCNTGTQFSLTKYITI